MIVRHSRQKPPHRRLGHETRHLAAETEMLAGAETQMSQRPAVDVIDVGIGEFAPVAVGRAIGEGDLVADPQRLAVQFRLARDRALEALRRGVEAQRFLDRRRDQRGIGDEAAPRVGIVVQVEREHAHEARQRFHAGHDERRRRHDDFTLAQPVAVDLGFGQMGDEIVGRVGAALRHFGAQEVAQFLERGDVLGGATFDGFVGRDCEDHLAADVGMIAVRAGP